VPQGVARFAPSDGGNGPGNDQGVDMHTMTDTDIQRLQGMEVVDSNGDKIGKLEDVYHEIETGQPAWLGIGTGFLHNKRRVVPAMTADIEDDEHVRVPYTKDMIKDSPDVDDEEIAPDRERELYSYYGVESPQSAMTAGEPDLMVVRVRRYVWTA
jgi:sporulation protein YlmC with PRC-barrel domain